MQFSDDFPMTMEVEVDLRDGSHYYGQPLRDCPPVAVAFGLYPQLDAKESKKAGHDVYKDVEFVKIAIPGDRNSLFFQPSNPTYHKRFPQAYAAFKAREKSPMEGMPIEQWAPISRSLALNLKTLHVHTVEALAAVHDGHIDRLGANGRELREKAKAWLAEAKDGAETIRLAAEKQSLLDQIGAMQAQILALQQNAGKAAQPAAPVAPQSDPTADVEQDVAAAARRPRSRVA